MYKEDLIFIYFFFFFRPKSLIVADFGCGEARLSQTIPNLVYSFDLVAANDKVTACDMSNVPLSAKVVDVVLYFAIMFYIFRIHISL